MLLAIVARDSLTTKLGDVLFSLPPATTNGARKKYDKEAAAARKQAEKQRELASQPAAQ